MPGKMRNATILLTLLLLPSIAAAQRASRSNQFRVEIRSTPMGAAVYLDGAEESAGVTPVWLRLRRGDHSVRLTREGYASADANFSVRRNWQRVEIPLSALGRLQLTADDDSAQGAQVAIDGEESGNLPLDQPLRPGRHSFTVSREGYEPMTRWFVLAGGQTYSVDVHLQELPPENGSLLVASDVSGAQVLLDGEEIGTTPLIHDVEPGEHVVEIRAEGLEPHSSVINVTAGERVVVNPTLLPERPPAATLRVLSTPEGATVWIDGEERGPAPLTVEDLPPGVHIVEGRAEGYRSAEREVTAEPERQVTIRLQLEHIPTTASIRVTSTISAAEVLLDGRPLGRTPFTAEELEPGEHNLVVRAPGHHDWEHRFVVAAGEQLDVQATPGGFGRLTVVSTATGAEVLVDGEVVGAVPLRNYEVPTGDHNVEIRAPGAAPFRTTISVDPGTSHQVSAELSAGGAGMSAPTGGGEQPAGGGEGGEVFTPAVEVGAHLDGPRFTRSAIPLPPFAIAVDAAWGWPYMIGAYRVGVGVWEGLQMARIDVAVEGRSSYYVTEFDVRARFGIRLARVIGLGAELSIGGGFGAGYPDGLGRRTEFVFGFTLYEGLELGPVAFALTQRLEVFSDEYASYGGRELQRQTGARVFLGGTLEVRIVQALHIWVVADYAPAQQERRVMCGGRWSSTRDSCSRDDDEAEEHWMHDVNLNVQAGLGLRFR